MPVTQIIQAVSSLSASQGGGGIPQAAGLYAWEWDSDNWVGSLPNVPYTGNGSSGTTSEAVTLTAAGSWSWSSNTWSNNNVGKLIQGSTSSYLQTPDFLQGPYASAWPSNVRTGLTIELWFYPINGSRTLISEIGAGGVGSAAWHDNIIELNSNGTIVADIWPYTGGPITTANSVNYNTWNHVIYTYDISTTTLSIQLNGGTVVSNSSKDWTSGVEGSSGLHYAIGYADATNLMANANITNFDGRWGKIRIANYPMASNYNSDWTKYNPFSVADSGTSLGASWTVEVVGEFFPSNFWATMWGNENWWAGQGHIAYFGNSTSLNVGSPSALDEYTLSDSIGIKAYWAFTHTDGGGIDVYRNGVLLTKSVAGYTQPASTANNTLVFGARHSNDGSNSYIDTCPGSYDYTNLSTTALDAATVLSNYTALQATYGI